jgi:hypothetical protein
MATTELTGQRYITILHMHRNLKAMDDTNLTRYEQTGSDRVEKSHITDANW